jgi:hypothetical protein
MGSMSLRKAVVGFVVVVAVLCAHRVAIADPTLVVLVRPTAGGASANEVLHRARGELAADGFKVVVVDALPEPGRVAGLTRVGRDAGAVVVAGFFVADDASTIDLSLVDEITGRALERHLEASPGAPPPPPEVLARRSVDVLRASLLDFLVETLRTVVSESHTPPKAEKPTQPSEPPVRPHPKWAIEAGLGMLASFQGLGPSIAPLGRLRFAAAAPLQLRATAAWLGTQPSVEATTGTATVEQGVAVLECIGQPWQASRIRPSLSLGAGVYYLGVTGHGATPPSQDLRSNAFHVAFDGGLGAAALLGPDLELQLEIHGLVTAPGFALRILDAVPAYVGRPSILGTITLVGWI